MKEQSPLQKVCMQYGKDCRALSNTYLLVKFLKANGQEEAAKQVEAARFNAKRIAKENYFANRKALQPEWKDWFEQFVEDMRKAEAE